MWEFFCPYQLEVLSAPAASLVIDMPIISLGQRLVIADQTATRSVVQSNLGRFADHMSTSLIYLTHSPFSYANLQFLLAISCNNPGLRMAWRLLNSIRCRNLKARQLYHWSLTSYVAPSHRKIPHTACFGKSAAFVSKVLSDEIGSWLTLLTN